MQSKKKKERNTHWSASIGNKPQKTTGVDSAYPGKELSAFLLNKVIVSPTLASATDRIEAER